MFSIQQLSDKIAELSANRLDADAFEDWFVDASWGHYTVEPDALSRAIAAVHHVLHSYQADEIDESQLSEELAVAIRPFEREKRFGPELETSSRDGNYAFSANPEPLTFGQPKAA